MRSGKNRKGYVSLVGAGCGKKEWITVEGLGLLKSCDVVVYDDLIDAALLEEVPREAERIYVGKRNHKPSAKQEDIQDILITCAGEGKHVVRLKGGDPFVFGRGGEEVKALNEHGIVWHVVPGISSALAIPAEAGIPVTHRGVSRSIHIMTAHTREDVLRRDMEQFAGLEGTLVFLMGLESLPAIVDILTAGGRGQDTPAAVLSGGNAPHHYKVTGTLGNIVEKTKEAGAVTPAVIVIGDVVGLDLKKEASLPLAGIEIGLTGTDDFQRKLEEQLLPLGAETISMMGGKCTELSPEIPWGKITDDERKWIVFTSVQGIRTFFRKCREEAIDYRRFAACRFAVIGAATGKELREYGFTADLCPEEYTSPALAEALLDKVDGERIYLFSSRQGTELLTERLRAHQADCHRYDIYDTEFVCEEEKQAAPSYILFGSAGGVRALRKSGYEWKDGTRALCIGPICAEAYRECFGREPVVTGRASAQSMIETLLHLEEESGR